MRQLAATFALVVLFGSAVQAESASTAQPNQTDARSGYSADQMPLPPDGLFFGEGGMPCVMLAQMDDDEDSSFRPRGGMGMMRGREMERGRKRIEWFRTIRLLELLQLDEDKEVEFLETYRSYRKDYRDLKMQRMMLVDSLADGLRSDSLDRKQIERMMTQADSLDSRGVRMTTDFYAKVRPMLTEEQLGKLFVFQARFEAEVLERIAEFRRGHEGMPPEPGMRRQQMHPDSSEDPLK